MISKPYTALRLAVAAYFEGRWARRYCSVRTDEFGHQEDNAGSTSLWKRADEAISGAIARALSRPGDPDNDSVPF